MSAIVSDHPVVALVMSVLLQFPLFTTQFCKCHLHMVLVSPKHYNSLMIVLTLHCEQSYSSALPHAYSDLPRFFDPLSLLYLLPNVPAFMNLVT
jgi:hypothetical protein